MSIQEETGSRTLPAAVYYYRRTLGSRELLPAIGAAVGAGLAAFYLARLMLQRTTLVREPRIAQLDERGTLVHRPRGKVARR